MNRRDAIFPFLYVGLSFAFIVASFLVYITQGKSSKWISHKMKTGAILLSLSASINACRPIRTCYAMPAPNHFLFNNLNEENKITLTKPSLVVNGTISFLWNETFSFALADTSLTILQKGKVFAKDGKFDTDAEEFYLTIDQSIENGEYFLFIFDTDPEHQITDNYRYKYNLIIR